MKVKILLYGASSGLILLGTSLFPEGVDTLQVTAIGFLFILAGTIMGLYEGSRD